MNKRLEHLLAFIFVILLVFTLFSCEKSAKKDTARPTEKLAKLIFYDSLEINNLEIIVEVVEDDYHRAKGLMFRENLPDNQGMLFIFEDESPRYFWMKNTTISLDIIYLDAQHKILTIHKGTTPLSEKLYPSEKPSMYVIEVRAGFTERYQVVIGDSVSWQLL